LIQDYCCIFSLCDKIDPGNHLDIAGLFSNTAGNFENVIQYNRDNRAFEVGSCNYISSLFGYMPMHFR